MVRVTERQICTNLWAFLHWLRATGRASLAGRDDLLAWREAEPERWAASIRDFARLPNAPRPLLAEADPKSRLVLRSGSGSRRTWSGDGLARGDATALPPDFARVLTAVHPARALTEAAAFLLLDADLRPNDRVLLPWAAFWPWAWALREGATLIIRRPENAASLRRAAEEEEATILVAPRATLDGFRPAYASLRRGIVAASGEALDFD